MGRRRTGSGSTPAVSALVAAGIEHVVRSYDHDPRADSYGEEAAAALGVDPRRVLKTLLARLEGAGPRAELVVGIVPVDARLDLKALARALGGSRATMAEVHDAERATGYVAGGISPVGQKRRHRTVVDASAQQWDTVLVSAGRRGLEVELAPHDLVAATDAVTATIGR